MRLWSIELGAARDAHGRWLAAVPVLACVAFAAFLAPRPAPPDVVPVPEVDGVALRREITRDSALAAGARSAPLPSQVREFGSLIRDWNKLESDGADASRISESRGALDRLLPTLLASGVEPLRALRAVQLEAFLAEVRRFETTGAISAELQALGGPFIERMRAVGWIRGRHVLLTEEERRVAYKSTWNGIAGVEKRADFAVTLDETRVLYGLYFRLPHAPEPQIRAFDAARKGAKDRAACDAIAAGERLSAENWRLDRIQRFANLDPSYPVAFAKGVAQFRMRKFLASADSFENHLRERPSGPYALKARNFQRAAVAASREEAP